VKFGKSAGWGNKTPGIFVREQIIVLDLNLIGGLKFSMLQERKTREGFFWEGIISFDSIPFGFPLSNGSSVRSTGGEGSR
jgi:hypothetical protein